MNKFDKICENYSPEVIEERKAKAKKITWSSIAHHSTPEIKCTINIDLGPQADAHDIYTIMKWDGEGAAKKRRREIKNTIESGYDGMYTVTGDSGWTIKSGGIFTRTWSIGISGTDVNIKDILQEQWNTGK